MSYYNLATNQVLLRSYEELALLHKRKNAPTESKEELAKTFGMSVDTFFRDSRRIDNYVYNFPLLSLNAAIIEGILRFILSQNLRAVINKHVEENSKKGQDTKSPYENILAHGTTLVETNPDFIDENNLAFFKQQEMLKDAKKLLDELYGENDLLKNISHYEVPEYFMGVTQEFLQEFKNKFGSKHNLSDDDSLFLDKIIGYSWGYRLV